MNVREVVDGLCEGQVHKCASCLKAVECNVSQGSTFTREVVEYEEASQKKRKTNSEGQENELTRTQSCP